MKSNAIAAIALFVFLVGAVPAAADDPIVRWQDVVGILQVGNLVGSGIGQIQGGGQPWTTSGGVADINLRTGHLHFVVKGLVLAGGNSIGTPGAVTRVKGTLVCDTNGSAGGGNSTLVDGDLVDLTSQGDAEFNGFVTLQDACADPDIAFVIRTGSGAWIANGAVRVP
jgi:hypothetical protein